MVTEDPLVAAFSVRMHVRCADAQSIACSIRRLSRIPVAWLPLDLVIAEYAHPNAPCPRTERVVMSVSSETRHGRMPNALLTGDAPLLFVQVLDTDEDGALVPMNILRGSPVTCVTLPQPSSHFSSAVVGRTCLIGSTPCPRFDADSQDALLRSFTWLRGM